MSRAPFTNVYGLARTLLALGTLLTLATSSGDALFRPVELSLAEVGQPLGLSRYGLFSLLCPHYDLARWIAVAVLAVVASGYQPRFTGVLHWWVSASTFSALVSQDGGGEEACDASTWKNRCEGNSLLRCNSDAGVVDRIDCSIDQTDVLLINTTEGEVISTLAGEVCGIDEGDFAGEYNCIGRGESCEVGEQGCDGSVLTACAGGHRTRRDCAKLLPEGMGCGYTPTGMATCGPTQTECELEGDETCDAGVIAYCGIAGPAALDCKALGYAGCKTTTDAGRTVASCTR